MPPPKRKLIPGSKPVLPPHEQKRKTKAASEKTLAANARKAEREAAEALAYPPEELLAFVDDDVPDAAAAAPAAATAPPVPDDSMREFHAGEVERPDPGPLPKVKRKAVDPRIAAAVQRAERTSKARDGVIEDEMPDPDAPSVAAPHPGSYDPLDPPVDERGIGRPTKYDPKWAIQARFLCKRGATRGELAECFGVSIATIYKWAVEHDDFSEALKIGVGEYDDRIVRSLAERASGYSYVATKVFMPAGAEKPVEHKYIEHVPPDVGAIAFWLKNRRKDEWRDVKSQELSGVNGTPIQIGAADDTMAEARRIAFALTTALQRAAPEAAASQPAEDVKIIDLTPIHTTRDAAE